MAKIAAWFSCGVASAVATKLLLDSNLMDEIAVVRCVLDNEHDDNWRFTLCGRGDMKVYLAGDMKSNWQDRLIPLLPAGVEAIDPRKHGLADPAAYTQWDLDGVARADAVIVYMDPSNPSGYGLSIEAGYARGLGKRIIFVDQMGADWRSKYFEMLRQIAIVVRTFHAAAALV